MKRIKRYMYSKKTLSVLMIQGVCKGILDMDTSGMERHEKDMLGIRCLL